MDCVGLRWIVLDDIEWRFFPLDCVGLHRVAFPFIGLHWID